MTAYSMNEHMKRMGVIGLIVMYGYLPISVHYYSVSQDYTHGLRFAMFSSD